jgi:hypothetical protein
MFQKAHESASHFSFHILRQSWEINNLVLSTKSLKTPIFICEIRSNACALHSSIVHAETVDFQFEKNCKKNIRLKSQQIILFLCHCVWSCLNSYTYNVSADEKFGYSAYSQIHLYNPNNSDLFNVAAFSR